MASRRKNANEILVHVEKKEHYMPRCIVFIFRVMCGNAANNETKDLRTIN